MKAQAKPLTEILAQSLWIAMISPVAIPAAVVAWLVAGRDSMDIGGGLMFSTTFAAASFGIAMLYVGLLIGYLI